jgi:hypothetical protein
MPLHLLYFLSLILRLVVELQVTIRLYSAWNKSESIGNITLDDKEKG